MLLQTKHTYTHLAHDSSPCSGVLLQWPSAQTPSYCTSAAQWRWFGIMHGSEEAPASAHQQPQSRQTRPVRRAAPQAHVGWHASAQAPQHASTLHASTPRNPFHVLPPVRHPLRSTSQPLFSQHRRPPAGRCRLHRGGHSMRPSTSAWKRCATHCSAAVLLIDFCVRPWLFRGDVTPDFFSSGSI